MPAQPIARQVTENSYRSQNTQAANQQTAAFTTEKMKIGMSAILRTEERFWYGLICPQRQNVECRLSSRPYTYFLLGAYPERPYAIGRLQF